LPREEKLPVATLGNSSELRQGELSISLGNPLSLQNTVALGIISAINRDGSDIGVNQLRTSYIQTDAAINQGNSGGPLINIHGEVIGIIAIGALKSKGIGFAIPIDTAKEVLNMLDEVGERVCNLSSGGNDTGVNRAVLFAVPISG
jgi:S1-C subfamily serine protease